MIFQVSFFSEFELQNVVEGNKLEFFLNIVFFNLEFLLIVNQFFVN